MNLFEKKNHENFQEQIAASSNRGRDLVGVQNLIKKHNALMVEITNHEPQIEQVGSAAEQMIQRGHFLAPDIREKVTKKCFPFQTNYFNFILLVGSIT